jgi:phosphomannomutase / phosphoglucomutase
MLTRALDAASLPTEGHLWRDRMQTPIPVVTPNTWDFLREAMIAPTGFREYDARWRFPEEVNLPGITALGLGLGTQMHRRGLYPEIVVGNDYRAYSLAVKQALTLGLVQAGVRVRDIGTALSPMAYFSQFHLAAPAVAMVTASHNPNGWTGVKMGFEPPLTHGPEDMAELRDIVLGGRGEARGGGGWERVDGVREAYIDDLADGFSMTRRLKAVCATGNGTASAFAPELLARIGVEVVPLHATLDYTFPHYNPNPEALEMLHDMAATVRASGADLALGFDGDGDRCGVVDDAGEEIPADKLGVILARDLVQLHPGATFVADVKSTGLFATDPELRRHGARADYWKTGHSHMKRRVRDLGALAGFEKSGHHFLAPPIGRGYDCGLRVAVEICKLLDRNPGRALSDLYHALPRTWTTPTMSPACADAEKYSVLDRIVARLGERRSAGGGLGGQPITDIVTVNGARVMLEGGAWALVRPSSNTPNLVVVCESTRSEAELRAIFQALDAIIREEPAVGAYDQTF